MKRRPILFLAVLILILVAASFILPGCGGGGSKNGGGNPNPGASPTPGDGPTPSVSPTPTPSFSSLPGFPIPGFDLQLQPGTYWHYGWHKIVSWDHLFYGSGSTTTFGDFTITLGVAITIGGVTAYPLQISGDNSPFPINWRYLASQDNKILASSDGTALHTIFDGATGQWQGGGFFTGGSNAVVTATATALTYDYIGTTAYNISFSDFNGSSGGIYFPGIGYIPGGHDFSGITVSEYFKPGIGPVGYYYSSYSSVAGDHDSTTEDVGVVETSLTATDGWKPVIPVLPLGI
jgi:hypothetical protein